MKIINIPKEKTARIAYIALLSIAALLVVLLLTGTIAGLVRQDKTEPLIKFESAPKKIKKSISSEDDIRVFSGLGRLRVPLSNSSILLLSLAFPYSASDSAFTEELAAKISDFRSIATGYFSALPEESIMQIDEETAKLEILRRFNESLSLGRIDALYFSDMMVIDAGL